MPNCLPILCELDSLYDVCEIMFGYLKKMNQDLFFEVEGSSWRLKQQKEKEFKRTKERYERSQQEEKVVNWNIF